MVAIPRHCGIIDPSNQKGNKMKKVTYKTMVLKLASTRASLYLSGSDEGIGTEIAIVAAVYGKTTKQVYDAVAKAYPPIFAKMAGA
jgi:hypothetical protein